MSRLDASQVEAGGVVFGSHRPPLFFKSWRLAQ
jgi:hypothetical protein